MNDKGEFLFVSTSLTANHGRTNVVTDKAGVAPQVQPLWQSGECMTGRATSDPHSHAIIWDSGVNKGGFACHGSRVLYGLFLDSPLMQF